MATTTAVRFPLGRYHATPWGRHVNEAAVEWPPSPWRLLRALYATWKTRAPELDADLVHALLEDLTVPPAFLLPPTGAGHSRHYFPDGRRNTQSVQGREGTDKAFDAFLVLETARPGDPADLTGGETDGQPAPPDQHTGAPLLITWPVDLPEPARLALGRLLDLLPYLGRADSVCQARLVDDTTDPDHPDTVRTLDGMRHATPLSATAALTSTAPAVPLLAARTPLDLDALTVRTAALRTAGFLEPPGAYWIRYAVEDDEPATNQQKSHSRPSPGRSRRAHRRPGAHAGKIRAADAVRWTIDISDRPSLHQAVAVADILRAAAQSSYGGPDKTRSSELLSGRSRRDSEKLHDDHQHAHYLAFDDAQRDKLIRSLVVWAPDNGDGLADEELTALRRISHLRPPFDTAGVRPARIAAVATGPVHEIAPELCGLGPEPAPATVWESWTPFAPARHGKRRGGEQGWIDHIRAEIHRELSYRPWLPPTADVEPALGDGDWLAFRRHRPTKHRLADARRATGVRIVFAEPAGGPISLGALSHFGLGLFRPVR
ncbi:MULTISPECIES: type I-U CRISPR-associated protein Csb2 [unclassified Frankia]|uniref:type I-G CRISPR-associated protein Csb2 n=1 Tax=unclassified Frankia TaxID=2632575 RepID=UPI002AD3863E|nr:MULTISPECIES: type I-U CRISPR-associated protein Csb2 [unclassified Frankia]